MSQLAVRYGPYHNTRIFKSEVWISAKTIGRNSQTIPRYIIINQTHILSLETKTYAENSTQQAISIEEMEKLLFGSNKSSMPNLTDIGAGMVQSIAEMKRWFITNDKDAVFYRTEPRLYHKFGNMVIFRPGNVYSFFLNFFH